MASDSPRPARDGEGLELNRLTEFLDQHRLGSGHVTVLQYPGGHSNLTYLVERGGDSFVLRRPPNGTLAKSAHDVLREAEILSRLSQVLALAPRPLATCNDLSILGAPFYVMERRDGVILRTRLATPLTGEQAHQVSCMLVDGLVALHHVDLNAAGLANFGKPTGYVQRQVSGWTERYAKAATDDLTVVNEVANWLAANQPTETVRPTLIHNDFKFDNVVFDHELNAITGILDWEMATVGDPLMDLGTMLAYWVQASDPQPMQMMRFGPTIATGMLTRTELAHRYHMATACSLDNIVFYYAFGLWKTAVVAQQIYARYARGTTKDPRFASFIHAVRLLCEQASKAISSGTLS